ncbi:MAG: methyltransferase domain-containing protein [Pirellulales bacterium]|nr:methyltransferase domain-containing protein [Pirellulales bacterium]
MLAIYPLPVEQPEKPPPAPPISVLLASGQRRSLDGLTSVELHELQWEQEQKFARAILAYPKDSPERALITGHAYDTICTILAAQHTQDGRPLVMGVDPKYVKLVLQLLDRQVQRGVRQPRLFEVGYGSGSMLDEVRGLGYGIGGIEVSSMMREQAIATLGARHAASLLLGDLRSVKVESLAGQPTLIYWNDVFEHIPPDEIDEYLSHLYGLLAPGGSLVTITPHWLLRPSDVTGDFCPLRTEARGFHFKEYRLAEVTRLLKRAGFRRVATPLFATHHRLVLCGGGGRLAKQLMESLLDRLPVSVAHLLCRGMAMSCTVAKK